MQPETVAYNLVFVMTVVEPASQHHEMNVQLKVLWAGATGTDTLEQAGLIVLSKKY